MGNRTTTYSDVTTALLDLLNTFPGLGTGDSIAFSILSENGGKAMFAVNGTVLESSRKDVLGNTRQIVQYPIYVLYRAGKLSSSRRAAVKEWLDNLGRWLEQEPVTIGNTTYTLSAYPALSGKRRFLTIRRTAPSFLNEIHENNVEDWALSITARYTNEF